jgi:hypothetical protein
MIYELYKIVGTEIIEGREHLWNFVVNVEIILYQNSEENKGEKKTSIETYTLSTPCRKI